MQAFFSAILSTLIQPGLVPGKWFLELYSMCIETSLTSSVILHLTFVYHWSSSVPLEKVTVLVSGLKGIVPQLRSLPFQASIPKSPELFPFDLTGA